MRDEARGQIDHDIYVGEAPRQAGLLACLGEWVVNIDFMSITDSCILALDLGLGLDNKLVG